MARRSEGYGNDDDEPVTLPDAGPDSVCDQCGAGPGEPHDTDCDAGDAAPDDEDDEDDLDDENGA